MIISPLNYTGNKAKVLNELMKLLPVDVDLFVDAFAGSGIVAFNSHSKKVVLNDINVHILELDKYLYENESSKIIQNMEHIIKKYGFTDTTNKNNVYVEYKHEGLSKYNKEPFQKLKHDYNSTKSVDLLFALTIYGFNHYLRFNKKDEYNVPVGKVDFSNSLREKTIKFSDASKDYKAKFKNLDYLNEKLYCNCNSKSIVYFDPPYLITTAPYNNQWTEEDDKKLTLLFDDLSKNGIRLAMSNVFLSNGKENLNLKKWAKKYNIHYLKRQYRNANYQKKNITDSVEVLITNYE